MGSDDVSRNTLHTFIVTYDEDIGFFVNESGWVVIPVAWREI